MDHETEVDDRERDEFGPPTRIGRFLIEREIGRGGQAVVYLARDPNLDRPVALKVLRGFHSEEHVERFRREAAVAARLEHPGICPVYDAGTDRGVTWIAMRYIAGQSLSQRFFRRQGGTETVTLLEQPDGQRVPEAPVDRKVVPTPHEVAALVRCAERVARTLQVAHEAGVVHRDIKPANILVADDDRPVILDFGLAREEQSEGATLTVSDAVMGTPAYMSPEQVAGRAREVGAASDIWSLGVCLYEGIAGERPFVGVTRERLFHAILDSEAADPRRHNSHVSRDLAAVTLTAIEKDPGRRYATMAAFADDLAAVTDGRAVSVKPPSWPSRAVRWARRRPTQAALVVATSLLLMFIGFTVAKWGDLLLGEEARVEDAVELALGEGFLQLGEGDVDLSVQAFRSAFELRPESPEATVGLAMALLQKDDAVGAQAALDAYEGPAVAGIRRIQADVLRAAGKSDAAAEIDAQTEVTDTPLDRFVLGLQALKAGHGGHPRGYPMAVSHLRKVLLISKSQRALHWYQFAHAAGHIEPPTRFDCLLAADTLRSRWPKSAQAWFWAGYALKELEPEESVKCYRKAKDLGITGVPVDGNLGGVLTDLGRFDEAIDAYRAAIDSGVSDRSDSLMFIGQILKDQKKFDEAMNVLQKSLSANRKNVDAMMAAGNTLKDWGLATNDHELVRRGVVTLERALEMDPTSALVAYNLGIARRVHDDVDGAIEAFEKAARIDPKYSSAWTNLAALIVDARGGEAAIPPLLEARRHLPDDFGVHYMLGIAYIGARRPADAVPSYRRATEISPDDPRGWCNLGQALRQIGLLREALDAYRRGHELGARQGWDNPSADWVRDHEALVAQLDSLVALADGGPRSADLDVGGLMDFAFRSAHYATGARFARRVLDKEPKTGDANLLTGGARLAARAIARDGNDATTIDDDLRADLRPAALDWLTRALAAVPDGARGRRTIDAWLKDPAFESLQSLVGLEPEIRDEWAALWAEMARRANE